MIAGLLVVVERWMSGLDAADNPEDDDSEDVVMVLDESEEEE